jgi:hypothetical protein
VGPRAVLDAIVKRKIPSPHRESNRRNPIFQPIQMFKCDLEHHLRGSFEKFMDWRQCAAVMQREAVTYAKL